MTDDQIRAQRGEARQLRPHTTRSNPASFRASSGRIRRRASVVPFLREFARRVPRRRHGPRQDGPGLGDAPRTAAQRGRRRPSLVVVPRSVVFNWKHEAARFAPDCRRPRALRHATGPQRRKHLATCDRHADDVRHPPPRHRRALRDVEFDYVILDEAQAIKNASTSATAKAARCSAREHRLALTGTPIENHLGELVVLFGSSIPGMLGRAACSNGSRRRRARSPRDALSCSRASGRSFCAAPKQRSRASCRNASSRRISANSSPTTNARYDELRDHYRESLLGSASPTGRRAAPRCTSSKRSCGLRQAACHPGLHRQDRADEIERQARCAALDIWMTCVARAQGARLLAIHLPARHRAETTSTRGTSRYAYLDGRRGIARKRRHAIPDRRRCAAVPHQPESRRPRPQPHRRRLRLPARPVVEPGRRRAGHRPRPPHRPDTTACSPTA